MPLPKIDKLSYAELLELQARVEDTIAARRAEEQAKLREKVAEMAAEAGLSLDEVISKNGKDRKRGKVAIKYRNPKDPSQTWTGRGRKPLWLAAELAAGKSLEKFAV
jgi:DNA-binding protein H-NS